VSSLWLIEDTSPWREVAHELAKLDLGPREEFLVETLTADLVRRCVLSSRAASHVVVVGPNAKCEPRCVAPRSFSTQMS
jgi:hypothetical protein